MMKWQSKPIGDFLSESKTISTNPSAERRIRVRLNAEGVEKRPIVAERKGVTRYYIRSSGQFIYGKQNLHKGAFGVIPDELDGFESSSDLPAFDISEDIRPKWIEYFFKQGDYYKTLVSLAKGAATKRIQPTALFGIRIPYPPLHIQDKLIFQMDTCCSEQSKILREISHQETLLTKLKQTILREAIQGKLTADWRKENLDVEPASQLLERIQQEKQRLIAEKKIRKEKPLPSITPEEIPFEIPDSWEWCRFGEVITLISGQHIAVADYNANGKGIPYLPGPSDFGAMHPIYSRWTTNPKVCANAGDILVTVKGSGVGKMNSLIDDGIAIGRQLMAVRRIILNWGYVWNFLASEYHALQDAKEGQIPGISREDITHKLVPVPSLVEQAAIVERVEASMDSGRHLETEIKHSRKNAESLLQTVLKEAFTSA